MAQPLLEPLLPEGALTDGTLAYGTINNCGNGITPWGTYLTCEENFNGYFGWTDAGFTRNTLEARYGLSVKQVYEVKELDSDYYLAELGYTWQGIVLKVGNQS